MKSKDTTPPDQHVIHFKAIFSKATTTIDGGWRVSFDLDAFQGDKATALNEVRDKVLQIAIVPEQEPGLEF